MKTYVVVFCSETETSVQYAGQDIQSAENITQDLLLNNPEDSCMIEVWEDGYFIDQL